MINSGPLTRLYEKYKLYIIISLSLGKRIIISLLAKLTSNQAYRLRYQDGKLFDRGDNIPISLVISLATY